MIGELRGEPSDAAALAAHGMSVAEKFGSSIHRCFALGGLARAHALRGEWEDAVRIFEETIAFQNQTGIGQELQGFDLASLAQALFALGQAERARAIAAQAVATVIERGFPLQELQNCLALARAEVALGNDAAVDPLLARCETLIAEMGAWLKSGQVGAVQPSTTSRQVPEPSSAPMHSRQEASIAARSEARPG